MPKAMIGIEHEFKCIVVIKVDKRKNAISAPGQLLKTVTQSPVVQVGNGDIPPPPSEAKIRKPANVEIAYDEVIVKSKKVSDEPALDWIKLVVDGLVKSGKKAMRGVIEMVMGPICKDNGPRYRAYLQARVLLAEAFVHVAAHDVSRMRQIKYDAGMHVKRTDWFVNAVGVFKEFNKRWVAYAKPKSLLSTLDMRLDVKPLLKGNKKWVFRIPGENENIWNTIVGSRPAFIKRKSELGETVPAAPDRKRLYQVKGRNSVNMSINTQVNLQLPLISVIKDHYLNLFPKDRTEQLTGAGLTYKVCRDIAVTVTKRRTSAKGIAGKRVAALLTLFFFQLYMAFNEKTEAGGSDVGAGALKSSLKVLPKIAMNDAVRIVLDKSGKAEIKKLFTNGGIEICGLMCFDELGMTKRYNELLLKQSKRAYLNYNTVEEYIKAMTKEVFGLYQSGRYFDEQSRTGYGSEGNINPEKGQEWALVEKTIGLDRKARIFRHDATYIVVEVRDPFVAGCMANQDENLCAALNKTVEALQRIN